MACVWLGGLGAGVFGQLRQILERGDALTLWEVGRQERVFLLQREIAVEQARSPLALGVRYAEIATRRATVVLLTAAQRGKLGLVEVACPTLDECLAGRAGEDFPVGQEYLGLSDAQVAVLLGTRRAIGEYFLTGRWRRWGGVRWRRFSWGCGMRSWRRWLRGM